MGAGPGESGISSGDTCVESVAFNISTALGGLLALVGFALGMMTGTFPFEALPAFWQDWV